MNSYDLAGKRAIVTGGAGGIGRAVAMRLLASGARVSLWDISPSGLADAVDALGDGAISRTVDITDEAAVAAALAADRAELGRIDVLINNAGILGAVTPLWESDPADLRRVIEVNLFGAMLCTRAVLAVMREQDPRPHRGHIVNVSSIQAKEGMSLSAAYSASKAGLVALTKSAAKDVAGDGIFVNCITPAAAETAMAKEITAERRADIMRRIPLGRFVELDEIARMVAWLVSDECSFSTGATFDLSGGRATF
jgi:NAD(P)-dependent dehydrogenase (short-subunit alcohol dehydrogenase family)